MIVGFLLIETKKWHLISPFGGEDKMPIFVMRKSLYLASSQ